LNFCIILTFLENFLDFFLYTNWNTHFSEVLRKSTSFLEFFICVNSEILYILRFLIFEEKLYIKKIWRKVKYYYKNGVNVEWLFSLFKRKRRICRNNCWRRMIKHNIKTWFLKFYFVLRIKQTNDVTNRKNNYENCTLAA